MSTRKSVKNRYHFWRQWLKRLAKELKELDNEFYSEEAVDKADEFHDVAYMEAADLCCKPKQIIETVRCYYEQ